MMRRLLLAAALLSLDAGAALAHWEQVPEQYQVVVPDYGWVVTKDWQGHEQWVKTDWLVQGRIAGSKGVAMSNVGSKGSSTVLSDRGQGSARTALTGVSGRRAMGADSAAASTASSAKAQTQGGSIRLDGGAAPRPEAQLASSMQGTYQTADGQLRVTLAASGVTVQQKAGDGWQAVTLKGEALAKSSLAIAVDSKSGAPVLTGQLLLGGQKVDVKAAKI